MWGIGLQDAGVWDAGAQCGGDRVLWLSVGLGVGMLAAGCWAQCGDAGVQAAVVQYFCFCSCAATSEPGRLYLGSFRLSHASGQVGCSLFFLHACAECCCQVLWPFPALPGQLLKLCVLSFL